jgi:hypothetical protein
LPASTSTSTARAERVPKSIPSVYFIDVTSVGSHGL